MRKKVNSILEELNQARVEDIIIESSKESSDDEIKDTEVDSIDEKPNSDFGLFYKSSFGRYYKKNKSGEWEQISRKQYMNARSQYSHKEAKYIVHKSPVKK